MLLYITPDFVKIDISIVRDVDIDRTRQKILKNMMSYTRQQGVRLIAEGVETQANITRTGRRGPGK